jgi:[pyruvate, water dikinase]-phosphate phosphotransferase / [pyruvate, water dikinase] kinase
MVCSRSFLPVSESRPEHAPELFVVSDGTGETAVAAVRAAATQFLETFRVRTFGETRHESQVRRVMERAAEDGALVVYTVVNESITRLIRDLALEKGVPAVDLLGPLISALASHYKLSPQLRPGILHGFSEDYFRRIEAVEFAVRHDDGANLHTLFQADLVLAGVSRTSKTPLSMYLAQRGYRTGNVPIVPGIEPPRELFEIDPRKVIGLVSDASALLEIRRARIRQLRASPYLAYADAEAVDEELRRARELYRRQGWRVVDITGKAVEEAAARILEISQEGRPA